MANELLIFPPGSHVVIHTTGEVKRYAGKLSISNAAAILNTDCLDSVQVGKLVPNDVVMFVIDRGWTPDGAPLFPINELATQLYLAICRPGTTAKIAGDVVLVHDGDFE